MNNRVISTLALAVALVVLSATVCAQSAVSQLPDGFNDSSSQRPAGFDDASSSQVPDGYDNASSDSVKPAGYGTDTTASQADDGTQALVDSIMRQNESLMTGGDEATACEVILCLSTGSPPGVCAASLARYFGITDWKFWRMIEKRLNFLKLCPAAGKSPEMSSLVEAMAHGAGRCDAATLNQTLRTWTGIDGEYEISNQMPSHCSAYYGHQYTSNMDGALPHYVDKYVTRTYVDGDGVTHYEYDGGYWADGASTSVAANDTNGAIPASKDPASVGKF